MVVGAFSKGANTAYLADCSRRGLIAKAARPTVRVVARRVRWPPARLSSDHIPSMIINGIPPNRSGSTDFKTTMMHRPESVFLKGIGIFRSNGGGSSLTCGTARLADTESKGLGLCCGSGVGLDDFIHSGIELCDCQRLLKIRQRRRILAHRLVVLGTAPLSVHRDLCSIEAAMQAA